MVGLKLKGCIEKALGDFRRILMWAAIFKWKQFKIITSKTNNFAPLRPGSHLNRQQQFTLWRKPQEKQIRFRAMLN